MKIILLILCLFIVGCSSEYKGKIITPDGKEYKVLSNHPMQLSVTEPNGITIDSDSRTPGIFESIGLSLGLYKGYDNE